LIGSNDSAFLRRADHAHKLLVDSRGLQPSLDQVANSYDDQQWQPNSKEEHSCDDKDILNRLPVHMTLPSNLFLYG
jgi:hypothetical protein